MLIKELLSLKKPVVSKGDNDFESLIQDVLRAIESNENYPWNCKFDMAYAFSDDEEFNNRISIKEIYKLHFQSDEDSILRVIVFDGVDIAYMSKSGDTRHWFWQFYLKSYMDSFLAFLRQVNDRLSSSDFESDCIIDLNSTEHFCQYIEFDKINNDVYVKNFKGFAWALENHNHPKKGFLIKNQVVMEVDIVEWVSDRDFSEDAPIKVKLHDEIITLPVNNLHFSI